MDGRSAWSQAGRVWPAVMLALCVAAAPQGALAGHDPEPVEARVSRPYPLVMPLDYPFARARAWLAALAAAASGLSRAQPKALAGLDSGARLALAAQVYGIYRVAPEGAPGHSVWLELAPRQAMLRNDAEAAQDDPFAAARRAARYGAVPWQKNAIMGAFGQPDLLALRREILRDTGETADTLDQFWPESLPGPEYSRILLAPAAQRLEALWELETMLPEKLDDWLTGPENLVRLELAARRAPGSPAAMLLLAEAQLQAGLAEKSAASSELGLRLADELGEPFLAARCAYVRALANIRLKRPALADTDLGIAQRRLAGIEEGRLPLIRYLTARGMLRLRLRNPQAMCDDLSRACALGDCGALSLMRNRGYCGEP